MATLPLVPFTGTAPKPRATAAFNPSAVTMDPGFDFRLSQGLKGVERGAAARGTLLTGGTQKALVDYGQNAASQEYQNAYDRALSTYGANRSTDAQNFGQEQTGYQDELSSYGVNRDTTTQNAAQERQAFLDSLALDDRSQATFANNPANGANGRSFSPDAGRGGMPSLASMQNGVSFSPDATTMRGVAMPSASPVADPHVLEMAMQQQAQERDRQERDAERMQRYQSDLDRRNAESAERQNAASRDVSSGAYALKMTQQQAALEEARRRLQPRSYLPYGYPSPGRA